MINTKDQEQLLKLIADYLEKDLLCIAIGGTAMMFLGYKTTTKDIDLVFQTNKEREIFENAIKQLGYKERSLGNIYDEKRKKDKNKPKMFTRGEERFDLFVKNVFGFKLNFSQNEILQRVDVIGKNELTINILSIEMLILLKAITGREKDFEDIETILGVEKNIDWDTIVNMAIAQKDSNQWILIDLEKTLQKLKDKYFIKQKFFDKLYSAQII